MAKAKIQEVRHISRHTLAKSMGEMKEILPVDKERKKEKDDKSSKKKGLLDRMRKLVKYSKVRAQKEGEDSPAPETNEGLVAITEHLRQNLEPTEIEMLSDFLKKSLETREDAEEGIEKLGDEENKNVMEDEKNVPEKNESEESETREGAPNEQNDEERREKATDVREIIRTEDSNQSEFEKFLGNVTKIIMEPLGRIYNVLEDESAKHIPQMKMNFDETSSVCDDYKACIADGTKEDLNAGIEIFCSALENFPAAMPEQEGGDVKSSIIRACTVMENDIVVRPSDKQTKDDAVENTVENSSPKSKDVSDSKEILKQDNNKLGKSEILAEDTNGRDVNKTEEVNGQCIPQCNDDNAVALVKSNSDKFRQLESDLDGMLKSKCDTADKTLPINSSSKN